MITDSASERAWRRMQPFLTRLAAKPETEAVVVLSNAAGADDRLSLDEHSDFDVGLVLSVPMKSVEWRPEPSQTYRLVRDRLPAWLPNFSFNVPVPWGALEVNVHQLIYEYEADERTTWDDAKCEAYAGTGRLLFDRTTRFEALIRQKAGDRDAARATRLAWIANRLEWDIDILPHRQADRGELLAAHYIVTRALDELVEACFLLSGRFVPNQKWRFFVLRQQSLLSPSEMAQLERALRCDPSSRSDLERRIVELADLWTSIRRSAPEVPQDAYRAFAATQLQLAAVTVPDAVHESLGERGYDLANYLLADSPESVAAALTEGDLPEEWTDDTMGVRAG